MYQRRKEKRIIFIPFTETAENRRYGLSKDRLYLFFTILKRRHYVKEKKISNQNYMDFIVVKNPEIEYETNDKGQVTVMIEWRGFYHRIAQRFFKRPKVSAIKLDDYGSFLWQSINDQKTVHQLSLDLQSQFPKMEKPLARLIRFLEILKDHHLIELKEVY